MLHGNILTRFQHSSKGSLINFKVGPDSRLFNSKRMSRFRPWFSQPDATVEVRIQFWTYSQTILTGISITSPYCLNFIIMIGGITRKMMLLFTNFDLVQIPVIGPFSWNYPLLYSKILQWTIIFDSFLRTSQLLSSVAITVEVVSFCLVLWISAEVYLYCIKV